MVNPNIVEDTKGTDKSQKTEFGKLKSSMNVNSSAVDKLINDSGIEFDHAKQALEKRNLFEIFLRSYDSKSLDYIQKADSAIRALDVDLARRTMTKIEKGKELNSKDIAVFRAFIDALAIVHKMRYGEKKLNVNASYNDIREMMMGKPKNVNP